MTTVQTFCACCGTPVALPTIDFCARCDGHVLKHVEGIPYWRATWAAQKGFTEDCPFDVSSEEGKKL